MGEGGRGKGEVVVGLGVGVGGMDMRWMREVWGGGLGICRKEGRWDVM
jgi:hypothetical protein